MLKWFVAGLILAFLMAYSPDWLRLLFALLLLIWAICFPFILSWSLVDLSSLAFLQAYYGLSESFARLGTRVDRLVLPLVAIAGLSESPLALFNRLNLANALMVNGRFDQALAVLKELDLSGENFEPVDSAFMPLVLSHLASVEHYLGQFDDAMAHLNQAMILKKSRLLRKDLTDSERNAIHISQAADLYSLGCFYEKLGALGQARQTFEQALANLAAIDQEQDLDSQSRAELEASFRNSLGDLCLRQGDIMLADQHINEAFRLRSEVLKDSLDADHPIMAASYENLGRLELARDNLQVAQKWLEKAYAIRLKASKYNTADLADSERSLAVLKCRQGEAGAAELLSQALVHKEKIFGESYPDVADVLETFVELGLGSASLRDQYQIRAQAIRRRFQLSSEQ